MKRACLVAACLALGGVQTSAAAELLSNPGFCAAGDGARELADIAYLSTDGVESHGAACAWSLSAEQLRRAGSLRVPATCQDATTQLDTTFTLEVDRRGRIWARADAGTGLPEFYFPCDRWGYKR